MKYKISSLVLIMVLAFSVQVSATGLQDWSERKTMSKGYAIKEYIYHFGGVWTVSVIGKGEGLVESPFIRVYKETTDSLEPVLIRIKKASETPLVGDILDWWNYGTNVTTFTLQPVDPEVIPDGNYFFVFDQPVTLMSFYYSSNNSNMPVYNENSQIVDFDNVLRDMEAMLKNRLQSLQNELTDISILLENNIQNRLEEIKGKIDAVNTKLQSIVGSMSDIRGEIQNVNSTLQDTNSKLDLLLYRVGFIIYAFVIICGAVFAWKFFNFYILTYAKQIFRHVL